jgi:hypothetical protein
VPEGQAVIGPLITGADIERLLTDTLKEWMDPYLSEMAQRRGEDTPPSPRGWAITGRDLQKYTSDQLPCIVVMAGGVTVRPRRGGSPGSTLATWQVDIGAIVNAAWGYRARALAQFYVRAISLILCQRPLPVDDTHSAAADFTGESYDELDFGDTRTYSASVGVFTVTVEDMMWQGGGPPPPASPPEDVTVPWEPWTTVREVDITVTNVPIGGDFSE